MRRVVALVLAAALGGCAEPRQPDSAKPSKSRSTENRGGIGVALGTREGAVAIIRVLPDTPAARAGFAVGDAIVSIDGASTAGLTPKEMVARIRGPAGTPVTVGVQRQGAVRVFVLAREGLSVPPPEPAAPVPDEKPNAPPPSSDG